jgi:1-acyl-sn-glycerol-3-phosphate acyltransferase
MRTNWLRIVPPHLGVRVTLDGDPYRDGPCLFVANHISYIDPIIILREVNAHVVAKSEVRRWPLVGLAGRMAGTIFVNREHKASRLKTALTIRESLESGNSILVFPEGTTTSGEHTLSFKPRSFESAIAAGVPVQPIAIQYEDKEAAFTGDQTFLPHFFRLFRRKTIEAKLTFGPVLFDADARSSSREWIEEIISPTLMQAI